ncbi:hypothetical protein PRIPAC_77853 [Pristionchus pacificus]|nr:hypothetical protein PRIPAC_77853 [Pristionchus pacificus]
MASIFGEYEWPIYIVTAVFLVLTTLGIFFNSLVVFATVQTKSLHNSCNVLIAFCATCDILHQTIPIFGLSGGSFGVLSIGIDRFLSAFLFIVLYCAGQYYLMFAFTVDQPIICIPPEAFYGEAKMLWSITSCIVYVAAVLVYCVVWAVLKRQQNMAAMTKIFRSLFIIMLVVVLGWMLTMSGVLIASLVFHLEGMKMYFLHETVGLFVNTSLVLNYFVYYKTSTEYRSAFRRHIRKASQFVGIEMFSSVKEERTSSVHISRY